MGRNYPEGGFLQNEKFLAGLFDKTSGTEKTGKGGLLFPNCQQYNAECDGNTRGKCADR